MYKYNIIFFLLTSLAISQNGLKNGEAEQNEISFNLPSGVNIDVAGEVEFEFIDVENLRRWESNKYNSFGQCVFGDAFFIKTPESLKINNLSKDNIYSYLAILLIYNRFDLLQLFLNKFSEKERFDYKNVHKALKKAKLMNNFTRYIFEIMDRTTSLAGRNYRLPLIN